MRTDGDALLFVFPGGMSALYGSPGGGRSPLLPVHMWIPSKIPIFSTLL